MKYNILMPNIVDEDDKDKSVEEGDDHTHCITTESEHLGWMNKNHKFCAKEMKAKRKANTLVIHAKTKVTPSDYCDQQDMMYL